MRQIGTIPDAADAKRFADYLLTLGITTRIDPSPEGAIVWVHREDRVQEAGAELAAFRANPRDPKYQAVASTARRIRKEAEERQREHEQKSIDLRNRWASDRSFRRIPVTQTLIALSILAYFLTGGGSGRLAEEFKFASIHPVVSLDEPLKPGTMIVGTRMGPMQSNVFDDLKRGEIWRPISPIFLHFGIIHLLFNMSAMIALGAMVELQRGSVRLLLFVFFAALVSNTAQYVYKGSPGFGGMSGVILAIFGYVWMKGLYEPELGMGLSRQTVMYMMLYLFVTMTVKIGPIQIAHAAHLSGLVFGVLVGLSPHLVPDLRGPDDGA